MRLENKYLLPVMEPIKKRLEVCRLMPLCAQNITVGWWNGRRCVWLITTQLVTSWMFKNNTISLDDGSWWLAAIKLSVTQHFESEAPLNKPSNDPWSSMGWKPNLSAVMDEVQRSGGEERFSPADRRKETSSANVARVSTQSYGTWLCLHCPWFIEALAISILPSRWGINNI